MADSKLTALSATTSITDDDIFYLVDDPAGTPTSKKITAATLKTFAAVGSRGVGNSSSSADLTNSTISKTVTAHATPHTKGNYTELIASTGYAAETLLIVVLGGPSASTVNSSTLMDIAFGAAASEVVQVANLNISHNGGVYHYFTIPLAVPSGSRVSARIQGAVTVQAITVAARVYEAGDHSTAPTTCTTVGADTATSNGLAPTTAGSTNTKAAWLEILPSAAAAYSRMMVSVGATPTGSVSAATGLIDIGKGAAASEAVIVGDIYYDLTSTEQIRVVGNNRPFTVSIAPGDRLAIRYQATSTNAAARPTVALHLFN